jgi:hypothetical protein
MPPDWRDSPGAAHFLLFHVWRKSAPVSRSPSMHTLYPRLAVIALLIAPLVAQAAKPAVPTVTVGADFKQLQFDVEPVSGASYYELWFLPNGDATWVKYMDTLAADPLFKVTVSGHLLSWFNARYRVTACNSDGCSSTANMTVTSHMKETVGYFKPRAAAVGPAYLGQSPMLSADGKTLAVLGGETLGPRQRSAVVYVYQKEAAGWRLAARMNPTPVEAATGQPLNFNNWGRRQVALSADGTTLVLGVPREFILTPNHPQNQGAIYIYRKSGTTWPLEQKVMTPSTADYMLGMMVDIDETGRTLAFWQRYNTNDPENDPVVAIWRRGDSGWTPHQFVPDHPTGPTGSVDNFDLSGDGKVLVTSSADYPRQINVYSGQNFAVHQALAQMFTSREATGIATNRDGSVIVAATSPNTPVAGDNWQRHIMAFRRGTAGWVAEPAFTYFGKSTFLPGYTFQFASAVAVSDDGRFVAVGDEFNQYAGTGAIRGPVTSSNVRSGAVFIFERKASSWALRSLLKPNVANDQIRFGSHVAFGDGNRVLAVGSIADPSNARDIDGDQTDTSAPNSGAFWLY